LHGRELAAGFTVLAMDERWDLSVTEHGHKKSEPDRNLTLTEGCNVVQDDRLSPAKAAGRSGNGERLNVS